MKISQREARELKKRVEALERADLARRNRWSSDYPGGTNFAQFQVNDVLLAKLRTVQLLEYAIVVRAASDGTIFFYACQAIT